MTKNAKITALRAFGEEISKKHDVYVKCRNNLQLFEGKKEFLDDEKREILDLIEAYWEIRGNKNQLNYGTAYPGGQYGLPDIDLRGTVLAMQNLLIDEGDVEK